MYSKEALSDIFERVLQFEIDAESIYNECIEKLEDETAVDILQTIRNEERGHIELARRLIEIIQD
jgi:rubrerythrin